MAYNTRFEANFNDLFGFAYKIEIKEDNFSGTITELNPGPEGFRLTYSGRNKTIQNYILGSKVEVELYITTDAEKTFIYDLATNGDKHFLLEITRDTGSGFDKFWVGYVLADLVNFDDAPYPFIFKIAAVDCFSTLQNIDYTNSVWQSDGNPSDVILEMNYLIHETIEQSGLTDHFADTAWLVYTNDLPYLPTNYNSSLANKLRLFGINTKTFAQYDTSIDDVGYTYTNCYDVLESMCKIMNCRMFQWEGYIWFIPYYLYDSNNPLPYDFIRSRKSGLADVAHETIDLFAEENDFNRFVGGVFDFLPAVKEVCVEQKYYYEPFATPDANTNDCGVNIINQSYSFFDNIVPQTYTNYGDHNLNITIGYKYNNEVIDTSGNGDDPFPDETEYVAVWRAVVSSGNYRLVNDVASVDNSQNITFTTAQWLKNGSQTYENTIGTTLDISDMDCFGFPDDSNIVRVYKNGVELPLSDYTYDKLNEEITFTVSLISTDIITVVFDYIGHGVFYYEIPELDITFNAITQSATDLIIDIPFPPEEGEITIDPTGSGTTHVRGYLIPSAASTFGIDYMKAEVLNSPFGGTITIGPEPFLRIKSIEPTSISIENNLSAQPTNTSDTIKTCFENTGESIEKVQIDLLIGGNTVYDSDSQILFKQLGQADWQKATSWDFTTQTGISFSGSLNECIAKLNGELTSTPMLKYQGNIQRDNTEYFNPAKGLKVQSFDVIPKGMFFSSGAFVAAEAEWAIQLIQLK